MNCNSIGKLQFVKLNILIFHPAALVIYHGYGFHFAVAGCDDADFTVKYSLMYLAGAWRVAAAPGLIPGEASVLVLAPISFTCLRGSFPSLRSFTCLRGSFSGLRAFLSCEPIFNPIIVFILHHTVACSKDGISELQLVLAFFGWIKCLLKMLIQIYTSDDPFLRRGDNLQALPWDETCRFDYSLQNFLVAIRAYEPKILAELRIISGIDPVSVEHNAALLALSVDMSQRRGKEKFAVNQIRKNVACSHRGKLVCVSHENKSCSGFQGIAQRLRQEQIQHRSLVDDYNVLSKRSFGVSAKGHIAALLVIEKLKEPMHRAGKMPACLHYTFCGSARRRRHRHL